MSFSVLNWALAKSVLENRHPNPSPEIQAEIDRSAIVASLISGPAGLMVPFIVDSNLPDDKTSRDGSAPRAAGGVPALPQAGGTTTKSDSVETRLHKVESKLGEIDKELGTINNKLTKLEDIDNKLANLTTALVAPKSLPQSTQGK